MTVTAEPSAATEAPQKRGRGRPPGAYGKYRPRASKELNSPAPGANLNVRAAQLNRRELNFAEARRKTGPKRARTGSDENGALRNSRREAFARNVAKGMGLRESYQAVGYKASPQHASANASDLSSMPDVAARISELKEAAAKKAEISAARVLEETGKIAFAKVGPGADDGDLSALSREQIGALNIKKGALSDLGKYLGMPKDRIEHTGANGGPIQLHAMLDVYLSAGNVERLSDAALAALETLREEARRLAAPSAASAAETIDGVDYAEVPAEDAGDG